MLLTNWMNNGNCTNLYMFVKNKEDDSDKNELKWSSYLQDLEKMLGLITKQYKEWLVSCMCVYQNFRAT